MFASKIIIALAASTLASASVLQLAERVPMGAISERATLQGWSLQSTSAQSGLTSCGGNSYCPSGLTCNAAGTAEVAACCTSGDCRGSVEGNPICADSSWSLWKGYNGNGFCCLVGEVGIYDYRLGTAGSCVSSAAADATTAVQMSTGSGAVATKAASAAVTTTKAAVATTTAAAAVVAASTSAAAAVVSGSSVTASASSTARTSGTSTASTLSTVIPTPAVASSNTTSSSALVPASSSASKSSSGSATTSGSSNASTTASVVAATGAASSLNAGLFAVIGGFALALAL